MLSNDRTYLIKLTSSEIKYIMSAIESRIKAAQKKGYSISVDHWTALLKKIDLEQYNALYEGRYELP